MYKYTHPQTPSITGTVDEAVYLKMKSDRIFKGYRWAKVEEPAIEPTPEIKPPTNVPLDVEIETVNARKALKLKAIEAIKAQEKD